ncbi:hypothetical protein ACSBR2_039615 [Camellia fascicularis]
MTRPWFITGDFNDISSQGEKRSYAQSNQQSRSRRFWDNMNKCGLMDLGCSTPRLIWSNNRTGLANTMEKLDRALCNDEWRTTFSEGAVRNLPRSYSDHFPLIVYTED